MHIAWLGKKTPFCGNVTYSREITNSLIERGHQVTFLHFTQESEENDNEFCSFKGYSHTKEVPLPCIYKSQIYTIPAPKSSKILHQSLQQLKPDLVHASLTLSPLDFSLPEICQKLNIPLVATFHPPFHRRLRNLTSSTQYLTYQLYAPFLAKYDKTIVFSESQRDLLVKLGVPPERLAIIPNGVDTQKYSPGKSLFKQQYPDHLLFLYQGRIAAEKNVESLLKAWKQKNLASRQAKLFLVGDGPLASTLKLLYNEGDGIHWLGAIAEEEKRIDILRGVDVFVLPSLVEGLSLSLLEAMACGLACVATDAGADGEVLAGAGIVISTQGVASQLKTILPIFCDHPEMTQILGRKARNRVVEKYTLSNNVSQLERLYSQLLSSRLPVMPG
ncbi:MAG: glycosyltransferase family 4 protein [Geminocystis sp.]|nr:glycosyltransferase family 4 protein [Geminocystis sp.]HIK37695.1 glycosyltransferase family 4 protein [Geminocystis sp. M7585_C2015_104]MCS7147236.1 glycosyltransferase family 4 protein [Geminocystis sp.]MCX8078539.1 glycosyltransferase family 4 protein [Geminocystis sp.]MDW8116232.1 glycosyltransferase family 4 protein [Geminocystis sp.]